MSALDFTPVGSPLAALPSSIEQMAGLEELVWSIFHKFALPEDAFSVVFMAVTEATSNAIRHGNATNPEKQVKLFADWDGNMLYVCVKDEGMGFNPNTLEDPTDPKNILKEGGRGVFLMRKFADHVAFDDNGSRVTMAFRMSAV